MRKWFNIESDESKPKDGEIIVVWHEKLNKSVVGLYNESFNSLEYKGILMSFKHWHYDTEPNI